jgi:hypothetical protein
MLLPSLAEWGEEEEEKKSDEGDDEDQQSPPPRLSVGEDPMTFSSDSLPPQGSASAPSSPSEMPIIASLKMLSRSFLSLTYSRSEKEDLAAAGATLVPLEKRHGSSLQITSSPTPDQQTQHHHPGERPGIDAVEMLNDTHREDFNGGHLQSQSLLEDEVTNSSPSCLLISSPSPPPPPPPPVLSLGQL